MPASADGAPSAWGAPVGVGPGPAAGETPGMLALAVRARVPLASLRSMVYAFPTFHGGIGEAIGAYGRGLVTVIDPQSTPLTS